MSFSLASVGTIIAHTPVWVWPLYALLLFLGWQRTRDSIVPVWRMLILPVAVSALAIAGLIGAGLGALPAGLAGFAVGGPVGWLIERNGGTRRLADGRLWLRGEWVSLVQIAVILVFRYATVVAAVVDPALNANLAWRLGTLFVATALSAVFIGRTAARLRVSFARAAA